MDSELTKEFMDNWRIQKSTLEGRLSATPTETGNIDIPATLNELKHDIERLNQSLHDATLYLPSYSVKMRQDEIRNLEKQLLEKEEVLLPKKKFGFKPRSKQPPNPTISSGDKVDQGTDVVSKSISDSNFTTIQEKKNEKLVFNNDILSCADVLIRNISNCTLHLIGNPSTLRIINVENSKIFCGPVSTSVFVESSTNSVLFLCCQQLRAHQSKHLDIYLRVKSRAIIEECSNIRFGPYNWHHPHSETLHRLAGIDSTLIRFKEVDDFNWLSSEPSPNWSVIPEQDYMSFPDPSE